MIKTRVMALCAGAATAGVTALSLLLGPAAQGSIIGDSTSPEQAGVAVTNGQIEHVTAKVYLRSCGQYASEVTSYGDSLQLKTANVQLTFGLSCTTGSGGSAYSPGLAEYNRAGTAPSDLIADQNGEFGSFSAPSGRYALMNLWYSKATGVVHATVLDTNTGQAASASYDLGLGASIREVDISNEVGCYSDTDPRVVSGCGSNVTPPAADTKWATFTNASVMNYRNKTLPITGSYLNTGPIVMTSNGSGTGTVLASPGPIGASGFSNFLRH